MKIDMRFLGVKQWIKCLFKVIGLVIRTVIPMIFMYLWYLFVHQGDRAAYLAMIGVYRYSREVQEIIEYIVSRIRCERGKEDEYVEYLSKWLDFKAELSEIGWQFLKSAADFYEELA